MSLILRKHWTPRTVTLAVAAFLFAILALLTALSLAQRQVAQVPLGPQQVVHTVNPKLGIHTRLTDEVEPWKI